MTTTVALPCGHTADVDDRDHLTGDRLHVCALHKTPIEHVVTAHVAVTYTARRRTPEPVEETV